MDDKLTPEQAASIQATIERMFPDCYLRSDPEDYIRADSMIGAFDDRGFAMCRLGAGYKLRATMALAHTFYLERSHERAQHDHTTDYD